MTVICTNYNYNKIINYSNKISRRSIHSSCWICIRHRESICRLPSRMFICHILTTNLIICSSISWRKFHIFCRKSWATQCICLYSVRIAWIRCTIHSFRYRKKIYHLLLSNTSRLQISLSTTSRWFINII